MQLIDNRALINDALRQSAELTGGRFDHRYWLSKVTDVKLLIISKPEVLFDLSVKVYIPLPAGQKAPLTYGDGWFNWHFLGSKSAVVTIAREILTIALRNRKAAIENPECGAILNRLAAEYAARAASWFALADVAPEFAR